MNKIFVVTTHTHTHSIHIYDIYDNFFPSVFSFPICNIQKYVACVCEIDEQIHLVYIQNDICFCFGFVRGWKQ